MRGQVAVVGRGRAAAEVRGGAEYSMADMAVWAWYGGMAKGLL